MTKSDELVVAERSYSSRLLVGTGKYKDFADSELLVYHAQEVHVRNKRVKD